MNGAKIILCLFVCMLSPFAFSEEDRSLYMRVDVRELLNEYAERTNTKFVIDPRVKGKIETIGAKPQDIDQASLIKMLKILSFAAIEGEIFIYIVPMNLTEINDGKLARELGRAMGQIKMPAFDALRLF